MCKNRSTLTCSLLGVCFCYIMQRRIKPLLCLPHVSSNTATAVIIYYIIHLTCMNVCRYTYVKTFIFFKLTLSAAKANSSNFYKNQSLQLCVRVLQWMLLDSFFSLESTQLLLLKYIMMEAKPICNRFGADELGLPLQSCEDERERISIGDWLIDWSAGNGKWR